MSTPVTYRFSFGPWNISEGGDPFGGEVRKVFPHEEKFALYRPSASRVCSSMTTTSSRAWMTSSLTKS